MCRVSDEETETSLCAGYGWDERLFPSSDSLSFIVGCGMCLREYPWKTSGEFQIKSDTNMALGPQHATQGPGKGEHYLDDV